MPSDSVKLGELVRIKHGFAFKGEYFVDEPAPHVLVTPGNFAIGGGFQAGKLKYYRGPIPAEYVLKPGDLIVTMTDLSKAADTLGYGALVPCHPGRTYLHNQRIGLVEALQPTRISLRWLHYLMRTPEYRAWVVGSASGSTVKHTSPSRISEFQVQLPDMATQEACADALDALEARIDLLRQTNATLESIAQALFKSWFIDFDPVRALGQGREPEGMDAATASLFPAEFEESALGWIPKGWAWSSLGALCASAGGWIQTGPFGSQLHASDYVEEGIPVVMPQDMQDRRVSDARIARVRPGDADRLAKHKLAVGDIVFSRRGDVGRHATVSEREVGWLCGTGCLLVRPGVGAKSPAYLSQALAHPQSVEWLKRHAVGATMPNLNTGILEALPLLSPTDAVLDAFERTVGSLEQRMTLNHAHASSLSAVRDQLLPRLISGKLRLPEAQEQLEDALA